MQGKVIKTVQIPVPALGLAYLIRVRRLGKRRFVMDAISPDRWKITFLRSMHIVTSMERVESAIAYAMIQGGIHER